MANSYRLRGYDTFSGEYATYPEALAAARKRLEELEAEQPFAESGGQDGIQDQVLLVHPDGKHERIR